MFRKRREYEEFIYALPETFPSIQSSTLILYMRSKTVGQLVGEICFKNKQVLSVLETIDFADRVIEDYSYEVYREDERLYWYDSWPHPHDFSLLSTHPSSPQAYTAQHKAQPNSCS